MDVGAVDLVNATIWLSGALRGFVVVIVAVGATVFVTF